MVCATQLSQTFCGFCERARSARLRVLRLPFDLPEMLSGVFELHTNADC